MIAKSLILQALYLVYASGDDSKSICEGWSFCPGYAVVDKVYYRIVKKTAEVQSSHIEKVFDAAIESIKLPEIKTNLKRERPVYLVSRSARDFEDFKKLENEVTSDGRTKLDLMGFGPYKPTPGFLSSDFEACDHSYNEEDIPFYEFSHLVQFSGMSTQMKERVVSLYQQYKVENDNYNIDSYAFSSEYEFFAELSQVFCEVSVRTDVTAGLDKSSLKEFLPDMYAFLDSIYDLSNNQIKEASCSLPCASQWSRCAA